MILVTNRAKKDIEGLPEAMQTKISAVIARLDQEPSLGWKLKGKLAGVWSVNAGRSHRILYAVTKEGITVKTVRPRRDSYR